jgi:predicted nucleotidyltransferase/DNA-binding transcriptional regulator YiaG
MLVLALGVTAAARAFSGSRCLHASSSAAVAADAHAQIDALCLKRYSGGVDADAGVLLAEVRREARLTQAELAHRAGTSQAMVARYETGAASPTVRTLSRLLRAAGRELVLAGPPARPEESPGLMASLLREHRADIRAAAEAAGARNVRVFGSVARGEETPESDVDLLVDFPAGERGLFPLLRLAREIEELVGRPVDVAAVEVMAEPVRERALAEAIPL